MELIQLSVHYFKSSKIAEHSYKNINMISINIALFF